MILQCDFDGTVIQNNLSVLLREHFAGGDWQRIESDFLRGKLTVEQSNRLQFTLVKEPKERLQDFVLRHVKLRPGFVELVKYCQQNAISPVIVSSGLDFYIEPVLAHIGLADLEFYCGRTAFTDNGIEVTYVDPGGNTIDRGFKNKYLSWLRQRAGNIVYVGDGLSDFEAARNADFVFATGNLVRLLRMEPVAWSSFTDFYDLLHKLRRPDLL